MGGLGSKSGSFRLGQCGLCGFRSLGKAGQIDAFGSFELLALRLYRGGLTRKAVKPIAVLRQCLLEGVSPGCEIRNGPGELVECPFRHG